MKKRILACLIGTIFMTVYAAIRFGGTNEFLTNAIVWSVVLDVFIWCIMYSIDQEKAKKEKAENPYIEQKPKTLSEKILAIKPKWIITAVVILALIFSAFFNNDSENTAEPTETLSSMLAEATETELPEEPPEETESEISTEPPKTINDDVDINFSGSVRNDATGNWRLARVATMKEIQEYALEYYNAYFKSDDEIHAIVNFSLNTTNRLAKVTSDILDIAVYDYVDKEEHDAKTLFSGTLLANYQINISTGEIEEIPLNPEPEEADPGDQGEAAANPPDSQAEAAASPDPDGSQEASNNQPHETADPNVDMVWVSATGSKYHSIPNCGRMDPDKARQVSKEEAAASGLSPCSKCY